ncbi:MAG: hypothetical protein LBD19_01110 [Endomicrobium sp.]|jgi:hypothetical protein|nr:hypothetical protein [Endomicrobium sp.]
MSSALASDNFGELNVKAGVNLCTDLNLKLNGTKSEDGEFGSKPCASFAGEFLVPAEHLVSSLDFLKFGVGLKYLTSAKIIPNAGFTFKGQSQKLSYLPIYFTLQINPFVRSNEESLKGLFVKGDIGYNAYFSSNLKKVYNYDEVELSVKDKGGLYYAFGAGYEFPFGVVFDITYGVYKSSFEWNSNNSKSYKFKVTNSCVGLNVGYKFKI